VESLHRGRRSARRHAQVRGTRQLRGGKTSLRARLTLGGMLVAVAVLVAVAFTGTFRSADQSGLLTASSSSSGPLFGTSVSNRSWLFHTTAEFGHMPVIGTYYAGLPPANTWTTGPDGVNKSAVVVSFSAMPGKILSGADDAVLSQFFDTAPVGRTIYYSYYRDPEAKVLAHRFTTNRYKAAWAYIVKLARRAHNPDLKPTLILSASDLASGSGVNWRSFVPHGRIISTLGWDAYPAGTLSDQDPRPTRPATFMGPAVAAAKSIGLPFGFTGFALATPNGRPTWLRKVASYLMGSKALFGVLSDSPAWGATELTDPASISAWRRIVARSGSDGPLPTVGPTSATPTPTPEQSTTSTPALVAPAAATGAKICGQPILDSPYGYDGAAGPYTSGTTGLPTYGTPGSAFPDDTAGDVLPDQTENYQNWQLNPSTVYYLEPGTHIGDFAANAHDAFVGGYSGGTGTTLSGNYGGDPWAIDSNSADGNQPDVTIEYLSIEKYQPPVDQVAIDQDGNTGWTIQYNTITLNVPGAGAFAASDSVLRDNCMTLNGQYGFQSAASQNNDSLTTGPYNVTVEDNEISYNDTCDLSGLMNNPAVGWSNYNPVPAQYRNSQCGKVSGDGNQGGFKLWETDGVTIKDNSIHNNWGPGGWADTDNANTTWTGNTITDNENAGIIEEISYNFSITDNYIADNDWTDGLNNSGFPQPAIYISESGSDTAFGGVPACPEASCADQGSYSAQSVISGNTLVDNGGSIFLWQNSNRYCSDGSDTPCTLVDGGPAGPFTVSACAANVPTASVSLTNFASDETGTPKEDWWDGCMWRTENVRVADNLIDFNPADIPDCNQSAWPDCGAGGIFSEYGAPNNAPGWVVPTQITFYQNDVWTDNTYNGPSTFYAWNQGNGDNPVNWADWIGSLASGDKCSSSAERQSGYCTGAFGQDAGSTYNSSPVASNP
jgi:hypothetical protein